MRFFQLRMFLGSVTLAIGALVLTATSSSGYDNYVFDNLQRSRDALLGQRADLQRSYNEVGAQIDRLQARKVRIDAYLRQVDSSLRDVEDALRNVK